MEGMEGKLVFEDTDYQCSVDHQASPGASTVAEATPRCAPLPSPESSTLFVPYGSSHYPSCQPSVKPLSIIPRVENNASPTTSTSGDTCHSVSPTSEFIQVSPYSCSTPSRPCSYHSLSNISKLSETTNLFPISSPAKQFHLQPENLDFQSHSEWKQMFDDAYEDRENTFVETEERLDQEEQGRIHRINQLCDTYERQFTSLKDEFRKRFTFTDDARSEEEKSERENRSEEEGEDHRWFEFQIQTLMFEQRFKTKEDSRWSALRSLWRNEVDTVLRELEDSMLESMGVVDIERALERSLKPLGVQLLDKPRSQLQVNDSLFQSVGNGKEQDRAFYPNYFKVGDDNDPDNNDIGWICRESNPIAETPTTNYPFHESSNREDDAFMERT
ncbi:hypothetical protein C8Q75DRAFT_532570 [Abortiporus biennis]|nr:hypothetical protein C8Q75DRAFT_532570 [Abortiporus biennis]